MGKAFSSKKELHNHLVYKKFLTVFLVIYVRIELLFVPQVHLMIYEQHPEIVSIKFYMDYVHQNL